MSWRDDWRSSGGWGNHHQSKGGGKDSGKGGWHAEYHVQHSEPWSGKGGARGAPTQVRPSVSQALDTLRSAVAERHQTRVLERLFDEGGGMGVEPPTAGPSAWQAQAAAAGWRPPPQAPPPMMGQWGEAGHPAWQPEAGAGPQWFHPQASPAPGRMDAFGGVAAAVSTALASAVTGAVAQCGQLAAQVLSQTVRVAMARSHGAEATTLADAAEATAPRRRALPAAEPPRRAWLDRRTWPTAMGARRRP